MPVESVRRPYSILVVGGGYDYIRLLFLLGYTGAKSLDEADFVLFTGGEDVNPAKYGEKPLRHTFFNAGRDDREEIIYKECLKRGLPMVGICRGGQFLNVMNDGKMWQHVDNHALGGNNHHAMIIAPKKKGDAARVINVTSTHHQQMIPAKSGCKVLAVGVDGNGEPLCNNKSCYGRDIAGKLKSEPDYEVLHYPKTKCLCFQPHPEYRSASPELVDYFDELLENLITPVVP
jgi:hypothetical protein